MTSFIWYGFTYLESINSCFVMAAIFLSNLIWQKIWKFFIQIATDSNFWLKKLFFYKMFGQWIAFRLILEFVFCNSLRVTVPDKSSFLVRLMPTSPKASCQIHYSVFKVRFWGTKKEDKVWPFGLTLIPLENELVKRIFRFVIFNFFAL